MTSSRGNGWLQNLNPPTVYQPPPEAPACISPLYIEMGYGFDFFLVAGGEPDYSGTSFVFRLICGIFGKRIL
jgi:hypothetical protein